MPEQSGPRPLSRGYTREAPVETEISALLELTPADRRRWVRAAGLESEELSPECMIYFMREYLSTGDSDTAWLAAERLVQRMARRITRRLSVWQSLTPYHKEEIDEALRERLYRVWLSREPENEFWEIRFNFCLDRALADEIDRVQRQLKHEETIEPEAGASLDPWDIFEDVRAMSPEDAAIVAAAVAALPEPPRNAFWLHAREEWTEEEIAERLGCTSRTVRNHLRRAKELLAIWRGLET